MTTEQTQPMAPMQPIVSTPSLPFAPYYQDDRCTIYHGDNRKLLPWLEVADLVLTDPPYGIFKDSKSDGVMFGKPTIYSKDKTATEWDKKPDIVRLRLTFEAGRRRVIWGGNYLADLLGECKGPLIWNKVTGNNSYADGEMAWSDIVGTMRIFTHQWCGAFKDSERGQRAIHPTQKPIALMQWCIGLAGDKVQTIVDPFMGSGTTLVAAKLEGRKAIGMDISEEYCEMAAQRLSQGVLF